MVRPCSTLLVCQVAGARHSGCCSLSLASTRHLPCLPLLLRLCLPPLVLLLLPHAPASPGCAAELARHAPNSVGRLVQWLCGVAWRRHGAAALVVCRPAGQVPGRGLLPWGCAASCAGMATARISLAVNIEAHMSQPACPPVPLPACRALALHVPIRHSLEAQVMQQPPPMPCTPFGPPPACAAGQQCGGGCCRAHDKHLSAGGLRQQRRVRQQAGGGECWGAVFVLCTNCRASAAGGAGHRGVGVASSAALCAPTSLLGECVNTAAGGAGSPRGPSSLLCSSWLLLALACVPADDLALWLLAAQPFSLHSPSPLPACWRSLG